MSDAPAAATASIPAAYGLTKILSALGHSAGWPERCGLVAIFSTFAVCAALAAEVAVQVTALPAHFVLAVLWAAWLGWHSLLFPRARLRLLHRDPVRAYRAAFGTHIVPGVSIGVSLMGAPGLHALLGGAPPAPVEQLMAAGACIGIGTALLYGAFSAIGLDCAGFLYEYVQSREPIAVRGLYRHVRHPLFLGGVIASVGAALAFADGAGIASALVNVAVLPFYKVLEDRRLSAVFGASYDSYRCEVAAFLPVAAIAGGIQSRVRRLIRAETTVTEP